MKNKVLDLEKFYPLDSLEITDMVQDSKGITIHLKSHTPRCKCPNCHIISNKYHGTYIRKVQDLPILGENVCLVITSHEYGCANPECEVKTIAETYDGFLSSYGRMTKRCEDFICTLALETSCEGGARICNALGIRTSGDTVIRLLIKRFEAQETPECSEIIGVDDFAFKKRHNYGTIIVDEQNHIPIAILNGRDGKSFRKWLKSNKHVKAVTRHRASAYAKTISDELPDAMPIADRFHLHQNLLEAIKKALNQEFPATIKIPHEYTTDTKFTVDSLDVDSKKNS